MIDDQELRAIQFLAERVRKATNGAAPWDSAGLAANLRKLATRNLHMTIEHVLRHAADPDAKTPGVLLGAYTPAAPTSGGRPQPPRKHEQCTRCGGMLPDCACRREHLAVTYDDETGAESLQGLDKRTAVEAARAALVAAKTADRAKQEAEAERKRAEDARRADLERMRREDDTARAALRAARGNEES